MRSIISESEKWALTKLVHTFGCTETVARVVKLSRPTLARALRGEPINSTSRATLVSELIATGYLREDFEIK